MSAVQDIERATAPAQPPASPIGERATDPRLGEPVWPLPDEATARRRARLLGVVCVGLAAWYLSWLLQGRRVGDVALFAVLIAAETFNLLQAVGFWWTCARQRVRAPVTTSIASAAVDVMIPVYDEPVEIVEATVAAATRVRGATARVWLLDDGRSPAMEALAERHGAGYITRPGNEGAKAGNINHALGVTDAPYVLVLDCDHVPRPEILQRTLGHLLTDERVAFVQTPQYYANQDASAIAAASAAQQALFFGPISRGKDGLGAMFCAGTNVVFRRESLVDVGGFPEGSLTEDFQLSIRLHERGWRSVYHPEVLALGLGPEDMASYVSQQQRWARGCLSALPAILRARLPLRLRAQYLLSATYFLSGWTLLVYMSLPVIRILTGLQPLAATTADQFLLHFAPYYVGALCTLAVAGYGTYTYGAFALASGSFWIHVQSTVNALLRRPARFVVTPKSGAAQRQPRAVAPALAAIAVLVGAAVYGLARDRSAATLNNVAFAALHTSVLATAVVPALRVGRSRALEPESVTRPAAGHRRALTGAAAVGLAAAALAAAGLLAAAGSRPLGPPANLSVQAHSAAETFLARYVDHDGRVVRRDQGGDTVSEGQAYGMLLAVGLDDRAAFQQIWNWTRSHLQRPDRLFAYHWRDGRVVSSTPAADADVDTARALGLAAERFGVDGYRAQAKAIAAAVLAHETALVAGRPLLVAGPWATRTPPTIDPSYFSPRAYADLDRIDPDPRWGRVAATSRVVVGELSLGGRRLVPDWASVVSGRGILARPVPSPVPGARGAAASGLDAVRVSVREAESCVADDRRMAAALWTPYSRAPGRAAYALDGRPLTSREHAASLVAAAAAARAAGASGAPERLLAAASTWDSAHPTYYGAAWVALGRMMLTSSALGGCTAPGAR